MKLLKTYVSYSATDTEDFAEQFAHTLKAGDFVLLQGDMGAGKTHFTKGLARGLGITDVVTSPTFALHNVYYGNVVLNHFDFYRITDSAEAEVLGLNEYFYDGQSICVVEWGNNVADLLPDKKIVVNLDIKDDDTREITIGTEQ